MDRRRAGTALIVLGILVLAGAGILYFRISGEDARAGEQSEAVREKFHTIVEETTEWDAAPTTTDSDAPAPQMQVEAKAAEQEIPEQIEIDGRRYLGLLTFTGYDLELPVQSDWDFDALEIAPARYSGSVAGDDLIIAAHNYSSHFSLLNRMVVGNEVVLTDTHGREIHYVVRKVEELAATAIEEMESGDWDLTLFTCTYGGQTRLALRCERMTEL